MTSTHSQIRCNFIDNEFCSHSGEDTLPLINPATGQEIGAVTNSSPQVVDQAVAAAKQAQPKWQKLPLEERCSLVAALSRGIADRFDEFVAAELQDTGHLLSFAQKVDIPRAMANLDFFAAAARGGHQPLFAGNGSTNLVIRKPMGVCALIAPWNLPLYLMTWKIAPALVTGNSVVCKPSELTPSSLNLLAEVARDCGLPPGVLQIIHGTGQTAGNHLIIHPHIAAISFTGSTAVGKHIATSAGPHLKKVSLELGGKNAALVFDDCNYEKTLETLVRASFANQGQICLCISRIYIHRSIYQQFVKDFSAAAKQLKVGDPMDPSSQQGALISQQHLTNVQRRVQDALANGAALQSGGSTVQPGGRCEQGYFFHPTVLTDCDAEDAISQEEVFGPVVCLTPFDHEAEALELANHSDYGLAACIFTQDLDRYKRLWQGIDAGIIWNNCWLQRDLRTPFGGMKGSGLGREGGTYALEFFTQTKNICLSEED